MEPSKKQKQSVALIRMYQDIFSTKQGEKVLHDIIKDCGVISSAFTSDPYVISYNEGRRSVALQIMQKLKIDTEQLLKTITEIDKERDLYEN